MLNFSLDGNLTTETTFPWIGFKRVRGVAFDRMGDLVWVLAWGDKERSGTHPLEAELWCIDWRQSMTTMPAKTQDPEFFTPVRQELRQEVLDAIRIRLREARNLPSRSRKMLVRGPSNSVIIPGLPPSGPLQRHRGSDVAPINRLLYPYPVEVEAFPDVCVTGIDQDTMLLVFGRAGMREIWRGHIHEARPGLERTPFGDMPARAKCEWNRLWHGVTEGDGGMVGYVHEGQLLVISASGNVELYRLEEEKAQRVRTALFAPLRGVLRDNDSIYMIAGQEKKFDYRLIKLDGSVDASSVPVPGNPETLIQAIVKLANQ